MTVDEWHFTVKCARELSDIQVAAVQGMTLAALTAARQTILARLNVEVEITQ